MTVPGRRPQRLGEQIREEISGLLLTELKDPRIGFTTITGVRVTPDLRQARVSVSVLGTADEQQRSLEGLRTAAAFIRRTLAHRLEVRRIPELEFTLDRTEERAARIDELLRQVKPADAGPEEKG
ncbi:MAG: 30S ribosome-binding factor RbfA [Candidatus Acidiferrales bacterium]